MKRIVLFSPLMLRSIKVQEKEYTLYDAACDALALRVQPSGAMSWVSWQKREGKTRRVTLGRFNALTLDEARTAARAHAHASPMDAMQVQAASRPCLTFSALAKLFITEKTEVYSEGGLASFKIYLRNQLLPAFGSKPVNRIATAELAQWFHMFSKTSPGGANQALGHFTTMMNWGQSKGHLPEAFNNPARPIKRNRRAARGRVLSAEQLRSLAKTLQHAPARYADAARATSGPTLKRCTALSCRATLSAVSPTLFWRRFRIGKTALWNRCTQSFSLMPYASKSAMRKAVRSKTRRYTWPWAVTTLAAE